MLPQRRLEVYLDRRCCFLACWKHRRRWRDRMAAAVSGLEVEWRRLGEVCVSLGAQRDCDTVAD